MGVDGAVDGNCTRWSGLKAQFLDLLRNREGQREQNLLGICHFSRLLKITWSLPTKNIKTTFAYLNISGYFPNPIKNARILPKSRAQNYTATLKD